MQPNPANTLLVQLIQIAAYGPTAISPATLSSFGDYSSSDVWTQTLAYLGLAFSLLAVLGAVLGKQCSFTTRRSVMVVDHFQTGASRGTGSFRSSDNRGSKTCYSHFRFFSRSPPYSFACPLELQCGHNSRAFHPRNRDHCFRLTLSSLRHCGNCDMS
jgi:hypothetical protein